MSRDPTEAPPAASGRGVRTASETDLPRLLAIQAAAFPDPHRTLLRSGVRAGLALVAVDGPSGIGEPAEPDETAGAVGAAGADVAGYVLFTVNDASVYVAELAVAPGHRRRGHGRRLLAAVAARHPACERLRLTTRADNDDARAFYASLGFREVRELPGYYDDGAERETERVDWSTTDLSGDDPDAGGSGAPDEPTDGVLLVRDLE